MKWVGALLIISGCGALGLYSALRHKKEINTINELIKIIEFMTCELQFRMSSLSSICKKAALETSGILRTVFFGLARELDSNKQSNVSGCMQNAIQNIPGIPPIATSCLTLLGNSLGRFDLNGQVADLENVLNYSRMRYSELKEKKDIQIQNYQTISFCVGAALAILLA